MQTTDLGPLTVSRLCLGAMLMGSDTPAGEAHRMLDRFHDAGGTFVDTADTYGDGASERTLAPWLARHRDEVVIATKVRFAVSDPGGEGLSPDRIRAAVLPWGPLGAGFLTGRYTRDHMPDGRVTRADDDLEEAAHRRAVERNFRVVDAATEIAARRNRPIPQIALAWLLGVPGVTAPIIGPRTLDQLDGLLGAIDIELDADERYALEQSTPPPDIAPHRMLRGQIGLADVPSLRRPPR